MNKYRESKQITLYVNVPATSRRIRKCSYTMEIQWIKVRAHQRLRCHMARLGSGRGPRGARSPERRKTGSASKASVKKIENIFLRFLLAWAAKKIFFLPYFGPQIDRRAAARVKRYRIALTPLATARFAHQMSTK